MTTHRCAHSSWWCNGSSGSEYRFQSQSRRPSDLERESAVINRRSAVERTHDFSEHDNAAEIFSRSNPDRCLSKITFFATLPVRTNSSLGLKSSSEFAAISDTSLKRSQGLPRRCCDRKVSQASRKTPA